MLLCDVITKGPRHRRSNVRGLIHAEHVPFGVDSPAWTHRHHPRPPRTRPDPFSGGTSGEKRFSTVGVRRDRWTNGASCTLVARKLRVGRSGSVLDDLGGMGGAPLLHIETYRKLQKGVGHQVKNVLRSSIKEREIVLSIVMIGFIHFAMHAEETKTDIG